MARAAPPPPPPTAFDIPATRARSEAVISAPQRPPQLFKLPTEKGAKDEGPATRARSGGAPPPPPRPLTPHEQRMLVAEEELAAGWEYQIANEENIKRLFAGAKLVVKPTALAAGVAAIGSAAKSLESSVSSAAKGAKSAASGAGAASAAAVLPGAAGDSLGSATATVVNVLTKALPIVGVVKGAADLLSSLYTLASSAWLKYHTAEVAKSAFAPGDPLAALEALREMLGREMKETAIDAASQVAQLGLDVAALVTTGGAALAVTSQVNKVTQNLVSLCKTVYLFKQEQAEVEKANEYLQNGPWNLSLFKYSPLLGCYLLRCSDASAIVNMAIGDYAKPGWKIETADIEVMRKKAEPLIIKAGELIRSARYEIPSFAYRVGIAPPKSRWNPIANAKRRAYDKMHQQHMPILTR
jgi:hypothetical protein